MTEVKLQDDLIAVYQEAEKALLSLDREFDFKHKEFSENKNKLFDIAREKIRALEKERDEKVSALNDEWTGFENSHQSNVETIMRPILRVGKILKILKIPDDGEDIGFDENTVHTHRERKTILVEKLIDEQYLKLCIFIYETSRPKNKYHMVAAGICSFNDFEIELPKNPCDLIMNGYGFFNVEISLGFKATIEELQKEWHNKKFENLALFLAEFAKFKVEVLAIKKDYKVEDFEDLFALKCKCGFRLTKRQMNSYSIREGKCPECNAELENFKEVD